MKLICGYFRLLVISYKYEALSLRLANPGHSSQYAMLLKCQQWLGAHPQLGAAATER